MKTKLLFLMTFAFFLINSATQLQSQNLYENEITFQDLDIASISSQTIDLKSYEVNIDDYELDYSVENAPKSITQNDAQVNAVAYALSMVAFGVGFGFTEFETLWCIHAEYYLRLALFTNSAIYAALGAGYNSINGDNFTANILDVTLKLLMFAALVKRYQQVKFLYGIFGRYGFGSEKFNDGFKTDFTRLVVGLIVGFQILISPQWSFMIQTSVLNYQEQIRKYSGIEIKDNTTWGLINKNNILAFSLVYTFANSKR
ncbi:hypothetical protein [Psychroserpens sp.]|uniref:hypothetical protein n=1 Tax=Psychroserpens sp. TaxID=2020870 RepID=UPI002B269693|nr:hypothetical protein [Psychroserpens sp.]